MIRVLKIISIYLLSALLTLNTASSQFINTNNNDVFLNTQDTISVSNQSKNNNDSDAAMLLKIQNANEQYSIKDLRKILDYCSLHCAKSAGISLALTNWLRENNSIYNNKSPSEINYFRGYLIYALHAFPPTEELYKCIKYELQFSDQMFNITAATFTAKLFNNHAPELIKILTPFLQNGSRNYYVDITTNRLDYPLAHPTKLSYEVINTLYSFGSKSYSSISYLTDLIERENKNQFNKDTFLINIATSAINHITDVTPLCCRHDSTTEETVQQAARLLPQKDRTKPLTSNVILTDQYNNSIKFKHLIGKPFILTFFYTSCANPVKCASTVKRLADLERLIEEKKLDKKAGIYAVTYNPSFDNPLLLRNYGNAYGVNFSNDVKFFTTQTDSAMNFFQPVNLRVNYGYGTVTQHGTQLFIFDKKGRLAALYDNEQWKVDDVYKILSALMKE